MLKTVFLIVLTTAKMLFPDLIDNTQPYQQSTPASKTISLNLYSNQPAAATNYAKVFVPKEINFGKPIRLDFIEPEKVLDEDSTEGKIINYTSNRIIDPNFQYNPSQTALNPPQASHYTSPEELGIDTKSATSAIGKYRLDSNFAGVGIVNVDSQQDFLDELELSYPDKPDFSKTINFSWKKIPRAIAYVCYAVGGKEDITINWNSSPYKELPIDLETNTILPSLIEEYVKANVFLSADSSQFSIPENIFSGCDVVMLSVAAFGVDSVQSNLGVTSKVVVRSITTVVLKSGEHQRNN
jgi:hypothetical protein